jgi:cytochrome d ubiquinol oxidase subunit II
MTEEIVANPELFAIPLAGLLAIANIPREICHGRDGRAFVSSCVSMVALMALFGIGMFPTMVFSKPNPANSLTIYNAASSQATLSTMLIIAASGMPIVLSYMAAVYWLFRGKVKLDAASY